LDPEWPRERLAAVAADAGLAALLTRAGLADTSGLAPHEVLVAELRHGAPVAPAALPRRGPVTPEAAAYVIYTSGSTGAAKGVVATTAGPSTSSTASPTLWSSAPPTGCSCSRRCRSTPRCCRSSRLSRAAPRW